MSLPTHPCHSPHTGGRSEGSERTAPATNNKGKAARRVRAPRADVVRRAGSAPPLPAAAGTAQPTARGLRRHGGRLRRWTAGAARAGVALRRRPAVGASSLCRRRSADRPLLWVGPNPDGPHRGQLAATVHERHTGSARPAQSRPRYRRHRAIAAAAADHRRRWHGRTDRRHGRLGVPGGFNPHHRKDPSYYPLLAHLAQTGHILRCKNRPRNVHDSKQAVAFLREVINGLRARFGRRLPLEFRMDAAFCQPAVLRLLAARGCGYAIKVGYWHWLPLKQLAADRQRWLPIAPEVSGFFHDLDIPQWNLRLRVMIYRKHVAHESPKNFQLDLFTPDDGHYEYAAVATKLALDLPALYAFICGRGAQEKTIAELKGEFALDVVPTHHYGANSAWQQLSVLAHNLARSFQLDTLATPKPRSRKRTYAYLIRSMRTLRFLLIARAGRLTRIGGRHVLRLSHNLATESLYASVTQRLAT